jgi:two-component system, cell cycle sensor histidine kinase and response regulator CckA
MNIPLPVSEPCDVANLGEAPSATACPTESAFLGFLLDATVGAVLLDPTTGEIMQANHALGRILGYAPCDLSGRRFQSLMKEAGESARFSSTALPAELAFQGADATEVWCRVSFLAKCGRPECQRNIFLVEDVTQAKNAFRHLLWAQRMEAIGQLVGGLTHNFNNLITVMAMHAERAEASAEGEVRESLQAIQQAATQAAGITRQLLAYSRGQILQPQVVLLDQLVKKTENLIRPILPSAIRIVCEPRSNAHVWADPGQIEQALLNIILNARDAMPQGGTLTIATERLESGYRRRDNGMALTGDWCRVSIFDTGAGMPPEVRRRIFEPFFTTKDPAKGTGLGLANAYGIVKQTGGFIWVDSEPGAGTCIAIDLPLTAQTERGRESSLPVVAQQRSILLVEDEPVLAALIRDALVQAGYRVTLAHDGEEALHAAQQQLDDIALVVTDEVMPRLRGFALLKKLREQKPALGAVVISGCAIEAGDPDMGGPPAQTVVLHKPFPLSMLRKAVEGVMNTR